MKPVELNCNRLSPDSAVILLRLDPDLFWFRGHFSVQPLLPGVAQLDWVMHYARALLGVQARFQRIQAVKFQAPLLPGDEVRLQLTWQANKGLLHFNYHRQLGEAVQPASSGKIRLCP